jgi:hypothetical protein
MHIATVVELVDVVVVELVDVVVVELVDVVVLELVDVVVVDVIGVGSESSSATPADETFRDPDWKTAEMNGVMKLNGTLTPTFARTPSRGEAGQA